MKNEYYKQNGYLYMEIWGAYVERFVGLDIQKDRSNIFYYVTTMSPK